MRCKPTAPPGRWGANSLRRARRRHQAPTGSHRSASARLTNIVGIAGGRDHGLALRSRRHRCWPSAGTPTASSATARTTDRADARCRSPPACTEVIAGAHHSYALRTDGQVWSWGRNYRAELGDGTTTTRTRPVPVRGVSNAVSIASGRDHGVAVLADGSVRDLGRTTPAASSATAPPRTAPGRSPSPASPAPTTAGGGGERVLGRARGAPVPSANTPPTAKFTVTLPAARVHLRRQRRRRTPDGTITSYAWDLGTVRPGPRLDRSTHARSASPGTYPVPLTVTDDDGDSGTTTTCGDRDRHAPPAPSVDVPGREHLRQQRHAAPVGGGPDRRRGRRPAACSS